MRRYFTFKKVALAHKAAWQKLRFLAGHGYYLVGKAAPRKRPFTMYDSVTPAQIPADAVAVAGYVNGRWPTFAGLAVSHPHARRLSIAVNTAHDAECLDVEQGDAAPRDAPAWVKRQKARGVKRPVVYCSVSMAPAVLRALAATGIKRRDIRLWTAHYTFRPHLCSSECGYGLKGTADATQYHDHALGRNLDASLCAAKFLD